MQEYAVAWGWAPWTDLLRVDVVNIIGLSMMRMGVLIRLDSALFPGSEAWQNGKGIRDAWPALVTCLAIALATPLLHTTHRPRWLPWPLESYVNGVHTFNAPQAWMFPAFPWAGFAFLGLAAGFIILSPWARACEARVLAAAGNAGLRCR